MRIALFTNTFTPHVGGVANSVSILSSGLRKRGHRCVVFAPEYPGQPEEEADVVRVPAIENFNGTGFSLRLPFSGHIHRNLDDLDPEIIHSHHPYLLGDAAMRSAAFRKVPIVFTHHTLYEQYVHHLIDNAEPLERLASELATEYANLCDHVIVPGKSIQNLVTERGVEVPLTVIPTGVDLDLFGRGDRNEGRKSAGIPPEAYVVGHVGRLESEKNLHYLAEAVAHFMKQQNDAWFFIAGDGSLKGSIGEYLQSEGVGDRAVFAGKMPREQLVNAYHAMDVFAFSSKSETQGMVLAEAMAAGVGVVALDASGVRDIMRDGENGRMLSSDTPAHAFAEVLGQWRKASTVTAGWKQSVRLTAESLSEERFIERTEDLYDGLVQDYRESRPENMWEQLAGTFEKEWELAVGKARAATTALIRK